MGLFVKQPADSHHESFYRDINKHKEFITKLEKLADMYGDDMPKLELGFDSVKIQLDDNIPPKDIFCNCQKVGLDATKETNHYNYGGLSDSYIVIRNI